MAHSFRKALNSYAPALTQLYREIRDKRDLAKPLPTPYDFMLAGPAGMAGSNWEVNEIRAFLGFIEERPACIDIGERGILFVLGGYSRQARGRY